MITENVYAYDEEFRDSIGTVDAEGKRVWAYPKKPKGRFTNARTIVSLVLIALLFAGPFITVDGHPLFLFNIFERTFILFGVPFWPQDFSLFVLAMITFVIFVVLFTVVYGRVWCGWACPQTVFMETVFRRIEYWIEGDANQQRKLNKSPWTTQKIMKRSLKLAVFFLISLLVAHLVMAYLIGVEQVQQVVTQPPSSNLAGFMGLMAFTGVFFFVFAYFREQACIVVCPYGRLQGVFLGKDSIVVAYDWLRGEPRGKLKKNKPQPAQQPVQQTGDCIDCKLCVHACPTNIDIRNGTQLECINCTACIDACDEVMDKVGKPRGLIRYDSHNGIEKKQKFKITPRIAGYTGVLTLLLTALIVLLATRSDIETTVVKVPGTLYQVADNGNITNLYNVQMVNKTFEPIQVNLRLKEPSYQAALTIIGEANVTIPANGTAESICMAELPPEAISGLRTPITLQLVSNGRVIDEINTKFLGPLQRK